MTRLGAFPASTGDARTDVIRQFRWAMAGPGLTIGKLALMTAVLELPAVRRAMAGLDAERRLPAAYQAIADAIANLGGGVHRRVLAVALAIDYDGDGTDLTSRRLAFAAEHNRRAREQGTGNFLPESARGLYAVEEQMLDSLVALLGAPRMSVSAAAPAGRDAGAGERPAWHYASREAITRLQGRRLVVAEIVDVIEADEDGVDGFTISCYCSQNGRRTSRLSVLEGGKVVEERVVGRANYRASRVAFARPLAAGEQQRVRWDIRYPPRPEYEPWFNTMVTRRTDHIVVRVAFDPECMPRHVWTIDNVPPAVNAEDRSVSKPLYPDAFGLVEQSFDSLVVAKCYGVAWEW